MPKPEREHKHLIPLLAKDVRKRTSNDVYMIDLPKIEETAVLAGKRSVKSLNLRCQGLVVNRDKNGVPRLLDFCNGSLKTIVGKGTGTQVELISCSKCRTAYIVRQSWDEKGRLEIQTTVYEMSEKLKDFAKGKLDEDYNYWVEFNS